MHYIYETTNTVNGKKYIGQRKCPKKKTPESDSYLGSGTLLLSAIKKYGKSSFVKRSIAICSNQKEADHLENYFFEFYNVLELKETYYNRGAAGQKWRPDYHKGFMSNTMKDFYKNPVNKEKLRRGSFEKRLKYTKKWEGKTYQDFLAGNHNPTLKQKQASYLLEKHGKKKANKILKGRKLVRTGKLLKEYYWHYINGISLRNIGRIYIIENTPNVILQKHIKHSNSAIKMHADPEYKRKHREGTVKGRGVVDYDAGVKVCSKCGIEKPLDNFSKRGGGKYRQYYKPSCKACAKKARVIYKDKQ